MSEFLKPWQRRAACATLVIALSATGMWFRSQFIEESAGVIAFGWKYAFLSAGGELGLMATSKTEGLRLKRYYWSREAILKGYRLGWPVVIDYLEVGVIMTLVSTCFFLCTPKNPIKSQVLSVERDQSSNGSAT